MDADLDVLRRHGALSADATVVDLGAGTGRFALAAAEHCARVVAVDVSPAMLEHLRGRASEAGLSNLEAVQGGFLSYRHDGFADAVYTRNALHQLPDFWKGIALQRMAGMLRRGGALRLHDLVYDVAPADAPAVLEGWMRTAAADAAVGYTAEDFVTHIRTEFSTYRWLLDALLDACGFEVVEVQVQRRVYATYTCLRR